MQVSSTTISLPINKIRDIAEGWITRLSELPVVKDCVLTGSIRRWSDSVERIDLAISTNDCPDVLGFAAAQPEVDRVFDREENQIDLQLSNGFWLRIWVQEPANFGICLLYSTGSEQHLCRLEEIAGRKGFTLSKQGLFSQKGQAVLCRDEEQLYRSLGLPYLIPELREDTGEIEAAIEGKMPDLINRSDLHADLHMHTNWSDGDNSIREMAETAIAMGMRSSPSPTIPRWFARRSAVKASTPELTGQKKEILKVQKELGDKIRIIHGVEVDIRPDGTLDLDDRTLQQFEIVIASLHTAHDQPREVITRRLINAIRHPSVRIIAHPSGRDIPGKGAEANWAEVYQAAADYNKVLEINSNPHHLDLNDRMAREAATFGVHFSIDTDSHRASALQFIRYGVGIARRAWLPRDSIITCLEKDDLLKFLLD
jgi:DNA polymerase (family 10)